MTHIGLFGALGLSLRARLLVVLREVLHKPAKVNGHVFLHRKTRGRGTAGFRLRFHGKRFRGLGFRVLGFRGPRVWGLGLRVWSSGFKGSMLNSWWFFQYSNLVMIMEQQARSQSRII